VLVERVEGDGKTRGENRRDSFVIAFPAGDYYWFPVARFSDNSSSLLRIHPDLFNVTVYINFMAPGKQHAFGIL